MMDSSERSTQSIQDIENSIQNSLDNSRLIESNAACCTTDMSKKIYWTLLAIFVVCIIIIFVIRLELFKYKN